MQSGKRRKATWSIVQAPSVPVYFQAGAPNSNSIAESGKKEIKMGIVVFSSLREAFKNGFEVYDRTADGYLVRARCTGRWAFAIVLCE